MHPILIKVWFIPIHSYGFLLAVSFLVGMAICIKRAERVGVNKNVIMDLAFWIILSAIVGARLYYVILHFEEFKGNLVDIVNPFSKGQVGIGGLVMYGGVFGAVLAGTLYAKWHKLSILSIMDIVAPPIGLGIFFTRIGCFLNGCCYGKCTDIPWAMDFPSTSPAGYFQAHFNCGSLHPTQLYLGLGGLLIFGLVLAFERLKKFEGHNFIVFTILYSLLRFVVDFFRHYEQNEMKWGLSHNQFFCILLLVVAAAGWIMLYMKMHKNVTRQIPDQLEDNKEEHADGSTQGDGNPDVSPGQSNEGDSIEEEG